MEKEKEKQDLIEELGLENKKLKEYLLMKEQQDNLKDEGLFHYEILMALQNLKHLEKLNEILNKLNEKLEKNVPEIKDKEVEEENKEEPKEEESEEESDEDGSVDKVNYDDEDENEDIPYEEEETPVVKKEIPKPIHKPYPQPTKRILRI